MATSEARYKDPSLSIEERVNDLLPRLSLREKIGQLNQVNARVDQAEQVRELARAGLIGSRILASTAWAGSETQQVASLEEGNAVQRVAVEETAHGIPIINGRDIIHGHRTVFPIPLGQAASFDPALIEEATAHSAREAAAFGVHWTFAPMLDLARDPRWGRVVEGPGEDPYLGGALARAFVRGFQGDDPSAPGRLLACAKHFVGYGTTEGGRDYASGDCSDHVLRNVYLEPFRHAIDAGCATVMSAFHDIDGVPISASHYLLTQVLKQELGFDGFVISDWATVTELIVHGVAEGPADAAAKALTAGVDMDMVTGTFAEHLEAELRAGNVELSRIDDAVRRILTAKFRKGLFERPYVDPKGAQKALLWPEARAVARKLAARSCVLLKNAGDLLPLPKQGKRIAVIGPLAHARRELLGSWVMDGVAEDVTPIFDAMREAAPEAALSTASPMLDAALVVARRADVVVVVLGESPERTGEAHNVTDLGLPRDQEVLLEAVARLGVPVVAVICAARPLPIPRVVRDAHAVLYAWHPGIEGGRAIADLLFGDEVPSGKLPVTIPRSLGQVPIFYNHKNGGRSVNGYYPFLPADHPHTVAYQDELGTPLFPFGFGLSYTSFAYSDVSVDRSSIRPDGRVTASATLTNTGSRTAEEVVQCYVRDYVGSVTRPLRELKGFQRARLEPGKSQRVSFELGFEELAFWNAARARVVEPGRFGVWIGGSCYADLGAEFRVT